MPVELSPLCPKAETLFSQIRRTIFSIVEIHRVNPKKIVLYTQATNEGFTVKVCVDFQSEPVPVYFRRHHEVKPVPTNEAEARQRIEYVMPRLVKRFECDGLHFHASIDGYPGGSGSVSKY